MVAPLIGAEYREESLLQVYYRVRDLVHRQYVLHTHPLAGSVKPNETPYKSVALAAEPGSSLDLQSLQLIEGAIQVAERMLRERPLPAMSPKLLADFALIDYSLMQAM